MWSKLVLKIKLNGSMGKKPAFIILRVNDKLVI